MRLVDVDCISYVNDQGHMMFAGLENMVVSTDTKRHAGGELDLAAQMVVRLEDASAQLRSFIAIKNVDAAQKEVRAAAWMAQQLKETANLIEQNTPKSEIGDKITTVLRKIANLEGFDG